MTHYERLVAAGASHDEALRSYVLNEVQKFANAEEAQRRSYEYTETMDGRYASTDTYGE